MMIIFTGYIAISLFLTMPLKALTKSEKPNIIVIIPDVVAVTIISDYIRGLVGYQTTHIDRTAQARV